MVLKTIGGVTIWASGKREHPDVYTVRPDHLSISFLDKLCV